MGKPAKGRITSCYSFRLGQKHRTVATSHPGREAGRETRVERHGGLPHLTSRQHDGHCQWLGEEGDTRILSPMDPDIPLAPLLP